jgi:PAS domain S-box-containing protein
MYLRPERHTEFVSTLNHHGSVNGFEAEMWRADGTVMWVSVIARTIHGNEGQPLYFEGRVFDITARKRAELALRRSEQRFRKLVETTGVIPFEFDLTTKQFSYLGPQAEVLLGESLRTGCSLNAWMAVLHPDDLEIGTRFLSGASSFVGVDTQVEFRMRAPGGRLIWIKQIVHSGEPAEDAEHARGFLLDITEAKQLEFEREHSQLKLRQLAAQSHNVREEERMIIAREIHDELGQALTLSKIGIAWLGGRLVKTVDEEVRKPLEDKITELDRMLDATLDTVRRILSALRPPLLDDLGLKAAMEFHVAEFSKRVGIRYDFQVAPHVQLPLGHATAIFRIFQEILTNIARHAKASRISIQAAEADSQFVLTVEDNGKGISPEDVRELKHFGILGMQERAWAIGGELEVYRRSGGGTRVALKVPLLPDVPEPPAHVEHPRITDKSKLDSGFHYRVKATVE